MNVPGVCFDSKLTWSLHVAKTINKVNIALLAVRLIKKYFTSSEIKQLITSNFYSILYYNSEIRHLPSLKQVLKQQLLLASARALKFFQINPDPMQLFESVHQLWTGLNLISIKPLHPGKHFSTP